MSSGEQLPVVKSWGRGAGFEGLLKLSHDTRGWHGEAYRGHIFWDELFIFSFLNLRLPELARELLMYRYRRLPEARTGAKAAGYRGAMFPWQSGSNGREESQVVPSHHR